MEIVWSCWSSWSSSWLSADNGTWNRGCGCKETKHNCLNWEEMKLKQIQTISQSRNASIDLWSLRCITWVHFCYSHIVTRHQMRTLWSFKHLQGRTVRLQANPNDSSCSTLLLLHVTLTDCWTSCCSAPVWMTMGWPGCLPCICAWMACSWAWVSWI